MRRGVRGSLSIVEGDLVRALAGGWPCRVGLIGLVDVGQGDAGEEAGGDEFGEADGRYLEAALAGSDAKQQIGNHCGQELETDGVLVLAKEGSDLEVLLD